MKKSFRDAYERELDILYERTAEFADEYPGLADRLGGLLRDNIDPTVAGLLEGTAFMAARVQLKLDSEFFEFTAALLDQILPDYLAPLPSAALIEVAPAFDDINLKKGVRFDSGAYVDAVSMARLRP